MLKLYLDNCCYNRPFDDLRQEKIKLEAGAIETIIDMYLNKKIKIYTSRAIDYEIDNISNGNKKRQIEDLYDGLEIEKIPYSHEIKERVQDLKRFNIHYMDAYHIAYAESKNLDYFITVDKQLINVCRRSNLKLKVVNPIEFIMEVI